MEGSSQEKEGSCTRPFQARRNAYLADVDADARTTLPGQRGRYQHAAIAAAQVEDEVLRADVCWGDG